MLKLPWTTRHCSFFWSVKKDDPDFLLGGRGVGVEFCFICNAIRVSIQHDNLPALNMISLSILDIVSSVLELN